MPGLVSNLKKISIFRSNNVFSCYLKVDLYGLLRGQSADDKKPKINRIKSKITYFEASNYEKKSKILKHRKIFQFLNLNNSLQEHFNPIKLN